MSLVLLLRQRGQMTADAIAAELEVSPRTVLRDIEALSVAGVPVYAERGRHGGYALLPGFRTELTGLTPEEAVALLTSGSHHALGLGAALASAIRKVVDALPEGGQRAASAAAERMLVDPGPALLPDRHAEHVSTEVLAEVRRAVLGGTRLRIEYAAAGQPPRTRTVDPLGLVSVRTRAYLLATRRGENRTYRLSRITAAQSLPEPADRPAGIDLARLWQERCASFLSEGHITVRVRVDATRQEQLIASAEAVRIVAIEPDGRLLLDVTYQDLWHAEWSLWQLGAQAEALEPQALRDALRERARAVVGVYEG